MKAVIHRPFSKTTGFSAVQNVESGDHRVATKSTDKKNHHLAARRICGDGFGAASPTGC